MEEDPVLPSTSELSDFNQGGFSTSRRSYPVGASLMNLGNTCFLNAILQCITHTVPLVQKIRSAPHSTPCTRDSDGFCSFCSLREHVNESIRCSGSVLMPERFKANLSKISSDFHPGQQEDAHEFLRCFLDSLHNCTVNPSSKSQSLLFEGDSIVKQVFGGCLRSQLRCSECGHCSDTFEPFLDLSLEIDKVDNLVDALESFTRVEKIEDPEVKFTCEGCKVQVSMEKQLKLDQAPQVIVLQLKRFKNDCLSIEKIDKPVKCPLELDLKPFLSCANNDVQYRYDLYGVVEHEGLPTCGHYFCTIRTSPIAWHQLNDSLVTSICKMDAVEQTAYILFYIRQGSSPWFLSLLDEKETFQVESKDGASPMSVLETIDSGHSVSAGEEDSCSSHRGTLEKNEACSCCANTLARDVDEYCGDELNKAVVSNPCFNFDLDEEAGCHGNKSNKNVVHQSLTPPKQNIADEQNIELFYNEHLDDEENHIIPHAQVRLNSNKPVERPAVQVTKDLYMDKELVRTLRQMPSSRRRGILEYLAMQSEKPPKWRGQQLGKKRPRVERPVLEY